MTIKQQGGVFGRHPEFATLSVADDVFSVSDTGAQVNGLLRVNSGANDLPLLVQSTDATAYMGFKDSTTTADMSVLVGASGDNLMALAKGRFRLYNDGQQSVQVETNGNFNVMRGNLIIGTSGKGIDFSATAGTGTSELFDDYEEGTWTPTYLLTTTDFDSITYDAVRYGAYTKIGNKVFCTVSIRTDAITVGAGAGSLAIGGLPFTVLSGAANNASSGLPGYYASWASAPGGVYPTAGQTYATIGVPGTTSNATSAILNTGANSNFISLQFFYTAA